MGGTGLVGRSLVDLLGSEPWAAPVRLLLRRPYGEGAGAGMEEVVRDPGDWSDPSLFRGIDTLFCALGTTRRAAGSPEAFRAVDLDLVVAVARAAASAGVPHFQVVSSAGADPASRLLYPRTKGEMEQAVSALPFESVLVLRPSLLTGPRREFRPAERLAAALLSPVGPLLVGPLAPLRPIGARTVATAMVVAARNPTPGSTVLESGAIRRLGSPRG